MLSYRRRALGNFEKLERPVSCLEGSHALESTVHKAVLHAALVDSSYAGVDVVILGLRDPAIRKRLPLYNLLYLAFTFFQRFLPRT